MRSRLRQRKQDDILRSTVTLGSHVDFWSNDYLGLAKSRQIAYSVHQQLMQPGGGNINGSTGSRLISGHTSLSQQIEEFIADYHGYKEALFFPSGYIANYGLLSTLLRSSDTVICDYLVHASIIDGCLAARATLKRFRHNNTAHLEDILINTPSHAYIVIESLYSMDGDFAPLEEIATLAHKYNASLIVDEAHAVGIYGQGKGLVAQSGLQARVFAQVITFGKAMGAHGAAVLGSALLKNYLINFCRPFIFSTAPAPHQLLTVYYAYMQLQNSAAVQSLQQNIAFYLSLAGESKLPLSQNNSPIQYILFSTPAAAKATAGYLQNNGIAARAIVHPTVPANANRIRICLHAFNTPAQITQLFSLLTTFIHGS